MNKSNKKIVFGFLVMIIMAFLTIGGMHIFFGKESYKNLANMPGYYFQDISTFLVGWIVSYLWVK